MTLQVPIHLMNLDNVPIGVSRDIAYVLTMGTSTLWTGIHTINILDYVDPGAGAAVSILLVRGLFIYDVTQIWSSLTHCYNFTKFIS